MELKSYLKTLSLEDRGAFAKNVNSSVGHIQNVAYGYRPCAAELAVLIERHSNTTVTRRELRSDWQAIWPELEHRKSPRPATPAGKSIDAVIDEALQAGLITKNPQA